METIGLYHQINLIYKKKIVFFLFFSCVADNSLGRTKKYIEVSGRPGQAEFLSPAYSGYLDLYNLTWTIESIIPLDEVRILYRKLMVMSIIYLYYTFLCEGYYTCFSLRERIKKK